MTTWCKIADHAIICRLIIELGYKLLQPALWQQLRVNKAVQGYRDYLDLPPSPVKKTQ